MSNGRKGLSTVSSIRVVVRTRGPGIADPTVGSSTITDPVISWVISYLSKEVQSIIETKPLL